MMTHRFLLDGMLGSLARWLRIMGYDTVYYVDKEDDELREEAGETGRILVTRDSGLYQKALKNEVPAVLIHSEQTTEQLKEINKTFNLNTEHMNTRCPRCNGRLKIIEKDAVKEKVPEESFKAFDEFWVCTECEAVYWKGSHWSQIEKTLNRVTDSNSL